VLFACPRVAPDWELGALRALMKPQARGAIAHRSARQEWRGDAERVILAACGDARERLGYAPTLHFPDSGDFRFAAEVEDASLDDAKGLALLVSSRLPDLWFVREDGSNFFIQTVTTKADGLTPIADEVAAAADIGLWGNGPVIMIAKIR